MNKRNTHSAEFKLRAVLEILKEEETISQIAQHYEKDFLWQVRIWLDNPDLS